MYTGKSSRNPYKSLIYGATLGIILIGFGFYEYTQLADWEISNNPTNEYKMNAILWKIYDLGGKEAILGFFSLTGIGGIIGGWLKTKELKKLKKQAK